MRAAALGLSLSAAVLATAGPAGAAPEAGALVVHTTVTTAQPRSGTAVQAQVWVAAAGATAAENATLSFSAQPRAGVVIEPVCTRTAQGYCKLGDVDSGGATIPFTITVKRLAQPVTVTVGAWTRADNVKSAWEYTKIRFAPAAAAATPAKPKPTPQPTVTVSVQPSAPVTAGPATSVAPPAVAPPAASSPPVGLPTIPSASAPVTVPSAQPEPVPLPGPDTRLTSGESRWESALALGQSVWLGALLAACALAAALLLRRGRRVRRRPDAPLPDGPDERPAASRPEPLASSVPGQALGKGLPWADAPGARAPGWAAPPDPVEPQRVEPKQLPWGEPPRSL